MENCIIQLYNKVLNVWGIVNQQWMLIEECGELFNAIAKVKRSRASKQDIITELADVHIMVEQMAVFYGWEEFQAEKEHKLSRLKERLETYLSTPKNKKT